MKFLSRFSTLALGLTLMASSMTAMDNGQLTDASPAKVEFAWDLHDTLLTMNKMGMAKTFLASMISRQSALATAGFSGGLLFDYARYGITGTVGSRQNLILGIKDLLKKGTVGEEYFTLIGNHDPALRAVAEQMACQFTPIAGMQEILSELTALGYKQRLASNIGGGKELENMKNKFPEIFKHIDGGKAVKYENIQNPVKKPSLQYFTEYQDEFNADRTKTVIFIDDDPVSKSHPERPANTAVAQQAGMVGITFKNAEQLRTNLKNLGIALS